MKSKLITLSAAALTLLASGASFAQGSFVDTMSPKQAPFVSQLTRAEVIAEAASARAFLNMPNDSYGSAAQYPALVSTVSREQVRQEAIEFAHTHKRDAADLG
jgi:ABC-type sugar transport system substrate-binding protein